MRPNSSKGPLNPAATMAGQNKLSAELKHINSEIEEHIDLIEGGLLALTFIPSLGFHFHLYSPKGLCLDSSLYLQTDWNL